jgi:hypothetical protein
VNLSVRTTAGNGAQTLIVGFVVSGSAAKPLLIRGIGPSLTQFGVTDALATPQLKVVKMSDGSIVAQNTRWGGSTSLSSTFDSVGAFGLDANSADDALVANLPEVVSGYSAQITGAGGATGTALAEVYDLDPLTGAVASRLINLSARAQVGTGNNILIAGFTISGNVPKQVLVRGTGPALTQFGVGGALANPKLAIYRHGTLVATNDDWGGDATLTTAFAQVSAFGLNDPNSKDAALLITLPPDSYSVQLSGVNNTTGVGLIEVYEMP